MAVCAGAEVVVGADPEAAGGVDVGRVGVGAGEVGGEAVVREDGVDEEGVGVAQDAQLAPARTKQRIWRGSRKNCRPCGHAQRRPAGST